MATEVGTAASPWAAWQQAWRDAAKQQQDFWRGAARDYAAASDRLRTTEPAAAARAVAGESVRFWKDLADATVRHGTAYGEAVAALTRGYTERAARAGTTGDAVRRVEATLSGPVGGEASTTFTVANPRPEPADVRFDVGVLRTPGGMALAPFVTFTPDALRLAPGAEQPVTMRVSLAGPAFTAGTTYRGTVAVHGSEELELALVLTVQN